MPNNYSLKISTKEIKQLVEDDDVWATNERQDDDNLLIVSDSESGAWELAQGWYNGVLCKITILYHGRLIDVIMLPGSKDQALKT